MGLMQRTKGATAEREVAALIRDLTGWDVRRRCRQHDLDSDLLGVPGWAIECKRQKTATRGQIKAWWRQTVEQATQVAAVEEGRPGTVLIPLLVFRADRDEWRAVWPMAVHLLEQRADYWTDYSWTVEGSIDVWAAVAREIKHE